MALFGWVRRKSKIVNGTTVGIQTNYQLKLIVHKGTGTDTNTDVYLGANVRNDFGDVRFTSVDGSTLLNYWIETYTSGSVATIWIQISYIPASPSSTVIYIYYDNPTQSTTSNGITTFYLFDDFANLSQWTVSTAGTSSATISNGILDIYRDGGNDIALNHSINFPDRFLYEIKVQPQNFNSNKTWFGWSSQGVRHWYERSDWASAARTVSGPGLGIVRLGTPIYGIWHTIQLIVDMTGTNVSYYYYENGALIYGPFYTTKQSITTDSIYLQIEGYNGVGHMYVDYVRTRGYVSPEPTFGTTGLEEISFDTMTISGD